MGLTIYLIGVLVSYLTFKWALPKVGVEKNWAMVFIGMLISTVSWVGAIAILIATAVSYTSDNDSHKPPKWLL